jgi:hypothetical protein
VVCRQGESRGEKRKRGSVTGKGRERERERERELREMNEEREGVSNRWDVY